MEDNNTKQEESFISRVKWLIGILFVGGLGSGFWDVFLKPVFIGSSNIILNIITFGMSTLKDNIYITISKGLSNQESLLVLVSVFAMFSSFSLYLGLFIFRISRKRKIRFSKNRKKDNNNEGYKNIKFNESDELTLNSKELDESDLNPEKDKWRWFPRITIPILFSITIIYFTGAYESIYVNGAITHYNQLRTICIPYVEMSDIEMFDSEFSQIQNGEDYRKIIIELENVAKQNNLEYNNFTIF